jgi:hypothetical protein
MTPPPSPGTAALLRLALNAFLGGALMIATFAVWAVLAWSVIG